MIAAVGGEVWPSLGDLYLRQMGWSGQAHCNAVPKEADQQCSDDSELGFGEHDHTVTGTNDEVVLDTLHFCRHLNFPLALGTVPASACPTELSHHNDECHFPVEQHNYCG